MLRLLRDPRAVLFACLFTSQAAMSMRAAAGGLALALGGFSALSVTLAAAAVLIHGARSRRVPERGRPPRGLSSISAA